MSKSPSYRPVVLIRGVLLAALALFLGGVVAVFVSNRMSTEAEVEIGGADELNLDLAETLLSGKGFDYEVTDGDQRLYHIRAQRILANRDNVVTLEGIVLKIERESGEGYELAAERGVYRSESGTAEVEGEVVLTGPDGVEMRGQEFDLLRKGSVVRSRGPVEFEAGGRISGSASELEAYLKKDRFQLSGDVRIFSQGTGTESDLNLQAKKIIYEKRDGLIHAEGGVRLRRGRDEMTCNRIAVTLASDGGSGASGASGARFVRARWNVVGSLISDDARGFERLLRFAGEEVSIDYGQEGKEPRQVEIAGTARQPARLDAADETGLVRRFLSRRIEAKFGSGRVRKVMTGGGEMILTEFLSFDAGRELGRVCGGSATARFDGRGELLRLEVGRGVDLHRSGLQVTGESLTGLGGDVIKVAGTPAYVYTRKGELSAPALTHSGASGDLIARGGVRARFPPESGLTMVKATGSTGDLPIQVTADSLEWGRSQERFQFEGDVRAWQGESFLTAQRLIGENGGRLRGEGGIQTTLERQAKAGLASEEEPTSPVRVTAESFDYSKVEGLIEYRGRSEVRDAGRLMSCDELAVYLRAGSDLDRLECRGDARIDDRLGGRKVRGSEALYRPDDSKVEVSGNPVTLEKPDGSVIRASRVIYDFETSIAQFQSASSTDRQTGDGAVD